MPRLDGEWRYDPARKQVDVTIAQTQAAEPYRLPVQVGVVATPGAMARVEGVELTGRRGTFAFPADSEPASVVLDPATWLLHEPGPFARARSDIFSRDE